MPLRVSAGSGWGLPTVCGGGVLVFRAAHRREFAKPPADGAAIFVRQKGQKRPFDEQADTEQFKADERKPRAGRKGRQQGEQPEYDEDNPEDFLKCFFHINTLTRPSAAAKLKIYTLQGSKFPRVKL